MYQAIAYRKLLFSLQTGGTIAQKYNTFSQAGKNLGELINN